VKSKHKSMEGFQNMETFLEKYVCLVANLSQYAIKEIEQYIRYSTIFDA